MNSYGNKKPFLTGPQMIGLGLFVLVLIGVYWFFTAVPASTNDRQCLIDAFSSQYTGGDFAEEYVNWKLQNGAITLEKGKDCPYGYNKYDSANCVMCWPKTDKVPMSPELSKKIDEVNAKRAQAAPKQEEPTGFEEE